MATITTPATDERPATASGEGTKLWKQYTASHVVPQDDGVRETLAWFEVPEWAAIVVRTGGVSRPFRTVSCTSR